MLNSILKPLQAVKSAFASLFPSSNKGLANMLLKITQGFERFAEKLKPSQEILEDIYWAFSGIFTAGKLVVTIFTDIVKAIFPVTKPLGSIASITVHILGLIGKYTTAISNFIIENGVLKGVIETIGAVLQKISDIMLTVLKIMGGGLLAGVYALVTAMTKGVTAIKNFAKNSKTLQTVITTLQNGLEKVVGLFSGFKKGTDGVTSTVKKAKTYFAEFNGIVAEGGVITKEATKEMTPLQKALSYLGTAAKVAVAMIATAFAGIGSTISKVLTFLSGLFTNTGNFFGKIKDAFSTGIENVKSLFTNIKDTAVNFMERIGINTEDVRKKFEAVTTVLKDFFSRITVGKVVAIAFAVALLYVSMASVKLVESWTAVGQSASGLLNTIKGTFGGINKFINTLDENLKKKTTFKEFAQSIAILSASLIALTIAVNRDKESFKIAAITLAAMASAAFLLTWGLTKLSNSLSKNGLDNKFNSNARGMLVLAGAIGILSVAMMAITQVDLSGETFLSIVAKLGMLVAMIGILATTAIVMSKLAPQLSKGSILLLSLALSMKVITDVMMSMATEDYTGVKDHLLDMAGVFAAFSVIMLAASKLSVGSGAGLLATALALKLMMPMITDLMRTISNESKNWGIKEKVLTIIDSINNWIHSLIEKYGTLKGNLAALATIGGSVAAAVALMVGAGAFLTGLGSLANLFKGLGFGILGMALGFKIIVSAMDDFAKVSKTMSKDSMKAFTDALLTFAGIAGVVMALITVINGLIGIVGHLVGVEKLKLLKTNFASVGFAFIAMGASVLLISQAVKIMAKVANDTEAFNAAKDAVVTIMLMLAVMTASASLVKKALPVIATFASILVGVSVILAELAVLALFKPEELITPALSMIGIMVSLAAMVHAMSKINDTKKLKVLIPVIIMLAEIGATLVMLGRYQHAWYDYLSMGGAISMTILSVAGLLKIISSSSGLGSNTSTKKMQLLIPLIFVITSIGGTLAALSQTKHAWYEYLSMGGALSAAILSLGAMLRIIASVKVTDVNGKISLMIASAVELVGIAAALRLIADQDIPNVWSSLGALEVGIWSLVGVMAVVALVGKTLDTKALIGTIALMVSVCGMLWSLAGGLYLLGDIDVDKMKAAKSAILQISGVMIALVAVTGIIQGLLVALGTALGGEAGAVVGAAAVPAVLMSIGTSLLIMSAALWVAAKAIEVFAGCLSQLVGPIKELADAKVLEAAVALGALGGALIPLAVGMALSGVACILGAYGLSLLAEALNKVGPAAEAAVEPLKKLSELDLVGVGKGMIVMAAGGLAMIPAAAGVALYAAALDKLAESAQKLQTVKTEISNFSTDVATAMEQGSQKSTGAAILAGLKTAAGYVLGFHTGAQWNSPPQFIVDFLNDVGYAIDDNWQITAKAEASGAEVGNAFGLGCVSTLQGWISSISGAMGGLFSSTEHKSDKYVQNAKKQYRIMSQELDGLNESVATGEKTQKGFWGSIKDGISNVIPDLTGDIFDIDGMLESVNQNLSDMTDGLTGGTEAMDGFGDAASGAGSKLKDLKDIVSSVKDSVANMDIFTKFEMKTEMTAEQMLENMKSNLDGVASWSHRMAVLAERGIDQALYQKLAEMGPQSYEQVNAFINMTDEQLQEANQMFQTSLAMPDAAAQIVGAGFKYAGEMAVQGFSNALAAHDAAHAAAVGLAQDTLNALNGAEGLDEHSPSKKTFTSGINAVYGLRDGILDSSALELLKLNIRVLCRIAIGEFNEWLSSTKTYEIGKNATMGLADGIADSEAAEAVLTKAGEIAKAAADKMAEALKEKSPSKITDKIGQYATFGLANGIANKSATKSVVDAAENIANVATSGLQKAIDQIYNFIDLNINPVITPILDFSYMQQQMQSINSDFGLRSPGAGTIQNGEETIGSASGGITYVQNNYSPKELSRIDIYRNTRNQLSMIGKVVRANA